MEEIVFWKEVPESEVPDDNDKDYWFVEDKYGKGVFLKRVVIPILSIEEIMDSIYKDFESGKYKSILHYSFTAAYELGYKAMQERLINNI